METSEKGWSLSRGRESLEAVLRFAARPSFAATLGSLWLPWWDIVAFQDSLRLVVPGKACLLLDLLSKSRFDYLLFLRCVMCVRGVYVDNMYVWCVVYVSVCLCVWECVCVLCVCMWHVVCVLWCVCVYIPVCQGQRVRSAVFLSPPYFWRQGLSEPSWPVNPSGPPVCLLHTGSQVHTMAPCFYVGAGDGDSGPQQALHRLSYLLSPKQRLPF